MMDSKKSKQLKKRGYYAGKMRTVANKAGIGQTARNFRMARANTNATSTNGAGNTVVTQLEWCRTTI